MTCTFGNVFQFKPSFNKHIKLPSKDIYSHNSALHGPSIGENIVILETILQNA